MKKSTSLRFVLPDGVMNRNPQSTYKMENDVLLGFRTAAASNQTRLAMEYLMRIVDVLVDTINEFDEKLTELNKDAPAVKTPVKKADKTQEEMTSTEG